jgi:hypothetical protein
MKKAIIGMIAKIHFEEIKATTAITFSIPFIDACG